MNDEQKREFEYCPTCGGDLDVGWECTQCKLDWRDWVLMPPTIEVSELSERIAREVGEPIHANNGVNVIVSGCLLVIEPHILPKDALTAVLTHEQAEAVMRDLAAAHNLAPQPAAWRGIESAPKDREIMLAALGLEGWMYASGHWADTDWYFMGGAWLGVPPTHWMPLPAPPSAVAAEPPLAVVKEAQTATAEYWRGFEAGRSLNAATLRPRDEAAEHYAVFEAGWSEGFQEAQRPDRFPSQNRCAVRYQERFPDAPHLMARLGGDSE